MKNTFPLILLVLVFLPKKSHAQLYIQSGATLHVSGSATLGLQNNNWSNNGTFTAGSGTVSFAESGGSANSTIGGSSMTTFNHLTVNMASQDLQLLADISVNGNLTFNNGQFNLDGFDVLLGANGQLVGESETSSFIGAAGGEVLKTVTLNAPNAANPGNLGAIITSAANLGTMTIARGHQPATNGGNSGIARYYDISPSNNTNLNATLRFQYLDAELNANTEAQLDLWRNSGSGWQNQGFSSRNTSANWVERTGIASFSAWTAADAVNALPVELLFFSGKTQGSANLLEWATASEQGNDFFEIQRSADGLRFEPAGTVAGGGTTTEAHDYSFLDEKPLPGASYYRLRQVDFDGKSDYSNVIITEREGALRMTIFPNPSPAGRFSVLVPSSDENEAVLEMFDAAGRRVFYFEDELSESYKLSESWSPLPAGIYLVRVQVAGQVFAERVVVE